ncbi:MAG: GNAT family N-acetyltransferase [Deltaproteobacteria bacterium]|nr:GNAT family N-acetyltransferase [Deltaproteobacteria bacterium]
MPRPLLEGFAEAWSRLAGGRWEGLALAGGWLVRWWAPDGRGEALPDRMYGVAEAVAAELDAEAFPPGCAVNLPPGVSAAGARLHCITHRLSTASVDQAWESLRRVGRQGVHKARRTGCVVDHALEPSEWFALSAAKSRALGGRAPHPELVATLLDVFGSDAVGLTGVRVGGQAAACVLWVLVEGYALLVDGASDRQVWDRNPNNLAVWEAVAAAIERGARHVDYGFSPPGAGDARFKDHMGGRELPLYRLPARGLASTPPT